ncbi:MAG: aminotransferase class IV [Planctomycetota bacterium]
MKIHLNGSLVDEADARISVFDRGFLFGDGVYELVRYFDGVGVGIDAHASRLARSLALARIEGFDAGRLDAIAREALAANALVDGVVYLQVTRGAGATRAHVPTAPLMPTVVAIATAAEPLSALRAPQEIAAITAPDMRWKLCEIKTISLMGNILHLLSADAQGAQEAILHRDGLVGEGAYSNVAAVLDGALVTSPIDDGPPILHGTARLDLLAAAREIGLPVEIRAMTLDELRRADELMITSSRRLVSAVTRLDGAPVGSGRTGGATARLFESMRGAIAATIAAQRTTPATVGA